MIYERSLVEGYLKKEPKNHTIFNYSQYKRYVTLDHVAAEMRICKSADHDDQKNG